MTNEWHHFFHYRVVSVHTATHLFLLTPFTNGLRFAFTYSWRHLVWEYYSHAFCQPCSNCYRHFTCKPLRANTCNRFPWKIIYCLICLLHICGNVLSEQRFLDKYLRSRYFASEKHTTKCSRVVKKQLNCFFP